jgi:hypothetical protein
MLRPYPEPAVRPAQRGQRPLMLAGLRGAFGVTAFGVSAFGVSAFRVSAFGVTAFRVSARRVRAVRLSDRCGIARHVGGPGIRAAPRGVVRDRAVRYASVLGNIVGNSVIISRFVSNVVVNGFGFNGFVVRGALRGDTVRRGTVPGRTVPGHTVPRRIAKVSGAWIAEAVGYFA